MKGLKRNMALTSALVGALFAPMNARATDCSKDIIDTNAEVGMKQAAEQYFVPQINKCDPIATYDPDLGFIEVYCDVIVEQENNSGLTGATALGLLGDETAPVIINGGSPQPLTQRVRDIFAGNTVYLLELNNSPTTAAAKGQTSDWMAPYAPGIFVSVPGQDSKYRLAIGPNPLRGSGRPLGIAFSLEHRTPVSIDVYDVQGREVATVLNETREPGNFYVEWDGKDRGGNNAGSGLYFVTLSAGKDIATRRVVKIN